MRFCALISVLKQLQTRSEGRKRKTRELPQGIECKGKTLLLFIMRLAELIRCNGGLPNKSGLADPGSTAIAIPAGSFRTRGVG